MEYHHGICSYTHQEEEFDKQILLETLCEEATSLIRSLETLKNLILDLNKGFVPLCRFEWWGISYAFWAKNWGCFWQSAQQAIPNKYRTVGSYTSYFVGRGVWQWVARLTFCGKWRWMVRSYWRSWKIARITLRKANGGTVWRRWFTSGWVPTNQWLWWTPTHYFASKLADPWSYTMMIHHMSQINQERRHIIKPTDQLGRRVIHPWRITS